MRRILARGIARDEREQFEFTIAPFVSGGFMLSIRFSGDGRSNITGAGVWPSIEKAKEIAAQTADRLLHGAKIEWEDTASTQFQETT